MKSLHAYVAAIAEATQIADEGERNKALAPLLATAPELSRIAPRTIIDSDAVSLEQLAGQVSDLFRRAADRAIAVRDENRAALDTLRAAKSDAVRLVAAVDGESERWRAWVCGVAYFNPKDIAKKTDEEVRVMARNAIPTTKHANDSARLNAAIGRLITIVGLPDGMDIATADRPDVLDGLVDLVAKELEIVPQRQLAGLAIDHPSSDAAVEPEAPPATPAKPAPKKVTRVVKKAAPAVDAPEPKVRTMHGQGLPEDRPALVGENDYVITRTNLDANKKTVRVYMQSIPVGVTTTWGPLETALRWKTLAEADEHHLRGAASVCVAEIETMLKDDVRRAAERDAARAAKAAG